MQAVAESIGEEAKSSGVGRVCCCGGFHLDSDDPAVRALNDYVDLDAGPVSEMREGKWFVDETGLLRQFVDDVAFQEEP